ncbi:hypothetical protein FLJC2902T_03890 [Flavobacterium limnosediminis JC2902]|uniref:Uncharacterized protein n=1 Tax=Flavobacterium limnosediminis JC2902 TaxID=1341181 RepID=V6STX1_9FLAO|nr:hypothetical protein [Flavobacterium limnosediminis]ESU29909.1 hypothetical protein FLJC2902T_03890 [Flavobacterium limnosediminis JC2902]
MKKIILLLFPLWMNAQIGIGTANPLADLHVGGNTSTIRIESLNAVNSPMYNNGIKPAHAFVNDSGDVTINPSVLNGTGPGGIIAPINFLLTNNNFIPDGASNRGQILNNITSATSSAGLITTVDFSSAGTALIEVKYSISVLLSKTDLNISETAFNDVSARTYKIYFCIDINDDGLSAIELSKKYGLNAQSYASDDQGILGYAYTNGHGYSTIPAGNHSLHFFAETTDGANKHTSIGFGGMQDLLRVRIYN